MNNKGWMLDVFLCPLVMLLGGEAQGWASCMSRPDMTSELAVVAAAVLKPYNPESSDYMQTRAATLFIHSPLFIYCSQCYLQLKFLLNNAKPFLST